MRWAEYVAWMRNPCSILVENLTERDKFEDVGLDTKIILE
jgi:hypothetical protein